MEGAGGANGSTYRGGATLGGGAEWDDAWGTVLAYGFGGGAVRGGGFDQAAGGGHEDAVVAKAAGAGVTERFEGGGGALRGGAERTGWGGHDVAVCAMRRVGGSDTAMCTGSGSSSPRP